MTFSFGNVTATEIKIKLLLVLQWYVSEAVTEKSISFLYRCNVIEMIVGTKNKKTKSKIK